MKKPNRKVTSSTEKLELSNEEKRNGHKKKLLEIVLDDKKFYKWITQQDTV